MCDGHDQMMLKELCSARLGRERHSFMRTGQMEIIILVAILSSEIVQVDSNALGKDR